MDCRILHELPGRLRLQCRRVPVEKDMHIQLERWVQHCEGLRSARFSPRTGSLLVTYSCALGRDDILRMVADLRIFEVATIQPVDSVFQPERNTSALAGVKSLLRKEIVRLLLPRPFSAVLGPLRTAMIIFRLTKLFLAGDNGGLLRGLARMAVFALFGGTFPARMALVVGLTLLRNGIDTLTAPSAGTEPILMPDAAADAIAVEAYVVEHRAV